MELRNEEVRNVLASVKASRENGKRTLLDLQSRCIHNDIGETTPGPDRYGEYPPIRRVCIHCGFAEESKYNTVWKVLKNTLVYKLSEDQLTKLKANADWI